MNTRNSKKRMLRFQDEGIRVPEDTTLLLVRHFETWWNHKKCSAIYGRQPMPARTDDDCDSSLSSVGRVQAVLTGWWLSKYFQDRAGKPTLDNVLLSRSRRSSQSWVCMKKLWDVHEALHTEQMPELTEIKHLSDTSQGQISVTLQDLAWEAAQLYKELPDDECRVKMHEYLVTQMLARGAGEQAIDHALKTPKIDILNRRKHPDGESYREKRKSLENFLRHYIELLNGKKGTVSIAVTHGRTYVAIRQWLENFSDDMARILQKAEGPPFPPHGSMTFYKEEGGVLVRQGDCYLLADGLKVSEQQPRLLDFVETPSLTPAKFEKLCRIAGVNVKSRLTEIPRRNEVGKMSHISYEKESSIPPAMPESGQWALTPTPPLPKVI